MKLSTRGRYAVTAMADIALHDDRRPVPLAAVAGRQDLSTAYLEKLFVPLGRAGLVVGIRGPGGGYRLSKSADDIFISDIFAAVDEDVCALKCREGNPSEGCSKSRAVCLTHDLWERLSALVHVFLQTTSLADVVNNRLVPCPAVPHLEYGLGLVVQENSAEEGMLQ